MRHDIHEDWIEFFYKKRDSHEPYWDYMARRMKEEVNNETSDRQQRSLPSRDT